MTLPSEPGFYQLSGQSDNRIHCYAYNGTEWMFIDLHPNYGEKIHTVKVSETQMMMMIQDELVRMEALNEWGIPGVD